MGEITNLHVPQRLEGETFEQYQERRYMSNLRNHMNAKGIMLWNSAEQGTYRVSENLSGAIQQIIDKDFADTLEESLA